MAKLEIGSIYLIRYRGKKVTDPTPVVLILWPGAPSDFGTAKPLQLAHGINLNYLDGSALNNIYTMIAQISTKQLSANNVYKLYHDYMRIQTPQAIKKAYRTYDPSGMTGAKLISKGFKESLGAINKFIKTSKQKEEKVFQLVKQKVEAGKNIKTIISDPSKLNNMSEKEANKRAREYLKAIEAIKNPDKLDPKKFTTLFGTNLRKK